MYLCTSDHTCANGDGCPASFLPTGALVGVARDSVGVAIAVILRIEAFSAVHVVPDAAGSSSASSTALQSNAGVLVWVLDDSTSSSVALAGLHVAGHVHVGVLTRGRIAGHGRRGLVRVVALFLRPAFIPVGVPVAVSASAGKAGVAVIVVAIGLPLWESG